MYCNPCDAKSKYYIGDVGTEIIVDTCENITSAISAKLLVQKPDRSNHEWIGIVFEDTKIRYIVKEGDFDQVGVYLVQAFVATSDWSGRGNSTRFKVNGEHS